MELQDELGLNLYDMEMRDYDPALGRWLNLDPVTHFNQSPYNAFDSNPVTFADPSGADGVGGNIWGESYGTTYSSPFNGAGANFSGQYGGLINPVNAREYGGFASVANISLNWGSFGNGVTTIGFNSGLISSYSFTPAINGSTIQAGPIEEIATDDGTMQSTLAFATAAATLDGSYGDAAEPVLTGGLTLALYASEAPPAAAGIVLGTLFIYGGLTMYDNVHAVFEYAANFRNNFAQGKGERGQTRKADGTNNPHKKLRDDPNKPGNVLERNSHTGKVVSKPAPPGYISKNKK